MAVVILNSIYGPAEPLQKIIKNTSRLIHCRNIAVDTKDVKLAQNIDSNLRREIPQLIKQIDIYLESLKTENIALFSAYLSAAEMSEITKIRNTVNCAKQEYELTLVDLK